MHLPLKARAAGPGWQLRCGDCSAQIHRLLGTWGSCISPCSQSRPRGRSPTFRGLMACLPYRHLPNVLLAEKLSAAPSKPIPGRALMSLATLITSSVASRPPLPSATLQMHSAGHPAWHLWPAIIPSSIPSSAGGPPVGSARVLRPGCVYIRSVSAPEINPGDMADGACVGGQLLLHFVTPSTMNMRGRE